MEAINLMTIHKEVVVEASKQTAFDVFTQKMDLWWPKSHHIGKSPLVESVLEGKTGGRWYSRHEDGSEVEIGKVLIWDPHDHLTLAWQVNGNFQYDPQLVTEVVVNFIPTISGATRVTMEHRDIQKLMGGAKVIADMDQGWGMILNLYKKIADEA
jgi:hypothetical protein